jgi:hypothetical protein
MNKSYNNTYFAAGKLFLKLLLYLQIIPIAPALCLSKQTQANIHSRLVKHLSIRVTLLRHGDLVFRVHPKFCF